MAASAGLILGSVAAAPTAAAAPVRVDATRLATFDAQMVSYINSARIAHGVPALTQASGLTSLAVWWSAQMAGGATGGNLQHNPNAFQQVTRYGAANRTAWGENVAKFTTNASSKAVFDAYMNSPGHRANILSTKYRYIGMGTMSNGSWAFNTMEFTDLIQAAATKAPAKPVAPAATKPATRPAPKPTVKPATRSAAERAGATVARATVQGVEQALPIAAEPAVKPAVPTVARGLVAASFGSLAASGMTVEIRDIQCEKVIARATTTIDGRFPLSLPPGAYCATLVSGPGGVQRPAPTMFTVHAGTPFTVDFAHLTRSPRGAVLHSRFVMQPR